ncbi:MAG: citrate/2-methylcitrate synthase, partial [Dehalococcoidia bacterium]|nr:citrate/2-methylcitrate synthase [Dehalococcoidia bacterium]
MSAGAGAVTVATAISSLADGCLRYRGYSVTELATRSTFPAVAHLLWTGETPDRSAALATEQAMIAARNALLPRAYRDGAAPVGDCLPACTAAYAAWLRDSAPTADMSPIARGAAAVGAMAAVMARVSRGHERRPPRAARFAPGVLELARGLP